MARTRIRPVQSSYSLNGGADNVLAIINEEEFFEDRYPGSCQCIHGKSRLYTGPWAHKGGNFYSVKNVSLFQGHPFEDYLAALRAEAYQQGIGRLNRKKLYTTNGFGLIQAVAEIDDTVAIFAKKFWRELSYGSISWGVMPLLSELKALNKYLKNASKSFEDGQPYVDQMIIPVVKNNIPTWSNSISSITGTLTMRYNGIIKYQNSPTLEMEKFFDRMGLHPDVNVVWDLIPLSFAVDWFIPVGDWLEDLFQSGWVRSVNFEGWLTTTFEWTATVTGRSDDFIVDGGTSGGTTFHRSRVSLPLVIKPPMDSGGSNRSDAQNAFDVWYLTGRNATTNALTHNNSNRFRRELAGALRRL